MIARKPVAYLALEKIAWEQQMALFIKFDIMLSLFKIFESDRSLRDILREALKQGLL